MDNIDNANDNKPRHKRWWIFVIALLIIGVSILVITPYIYIYRNIMFPEKQLKDRYRDFPHIAIITVSGFRNLEEEVIAKELIEARTEWIHNQKSDWDKYGRRRNYTLDLSQDGKITVIFGYEEGFDVNTFANEIIKAADVHFIDLNNNHVIYNTDILSARYVWQGTTKAYDVIIKMTEDGMQRFLTVNETVDKTDSPIQVDFKGSILSDYFTVEVSDNNTIIISGFINMGAAEALVKLIELKEVPTDLKVELNIE